MRREYTSSGYTQLEYIESTGTEYLDSEFKPNNNTRVVCSYTVTKLSDNLAGSCTPFGSRKGWMDTMFIGHTPANNARDVYMCYGNERYYSSNYSILNSRILYDANKNNWSCTIGNSVYTHVFSNSYFQTTGNCFIFKGNYYGNLSDGLDPNDNSRIRMFLCQIYDNGTLIRDYIPMLRSDGKPGMYDLCGSICPLTGTPFYVNAGTGEFLYA